MSTCSEVRELRDRFRTVCDLVPTERPVAPLERAAVFAVCYSWYHSLSPDTTLDRIEWWNKHQRLCVEEGEVPVYVRRAKDLAEEVCKHLGDNRPLLSYFATASDDDPMAAAERVLGSFVRRT